MKAVYDLSTSLLIIMGEAIQTFVITIEEMGEYILEYCIQAASGEATPKAVLLNQDDFIPWKRGVSL